MKQAERLPKLKLRLNELLGDMSVTEFAKKLGLSRQTVGFYLNGDRIPDSETLVQICKTCNISSDWLLGLSDVKSTNTDLRAACEYTGLSEIAIEIIKRLIILKYTSLEYFLAADSFYSLADTLEELFLSIMHLDKVLDNPSDLAAWSRNLPEYIHLQYVSTEIEKRLRNVRYLRYQTCEELKKVIDEIFDYDKTDTRAVSIISDMEKTLDKYGTVDERLQMAHQYFRDNKRRKQNAISQEENE